MKITVTQRGCGVSALTIVAMMGASQASAQISAPPPAEEVARADATRSNVDRRTHPTPDIEEIIVTAEKRETRIERTPVAITALSGKTLQAEQIHTLTDISTLVPSFKMGDNSGYQQITIRGIGIQNFTPGADGTVSVNVNEVNISRTVAQSTSLYDVSNLEVLRGPQGTLYGRNASAGSVNISTTLPTDVYSGYGRVIVGNYDDLNVEGAFGGPLIGDKVLFRIAGFYETRDGYGTNLGTGTKIDNRRARAIRATLVAKPAPDLTATLIAEHFDEKDHGAGLHFFGSAGLTGIPGATGAPALWQTLGGYTSKRPWDTATPEDPYFRLSTNAVTGVINWGLGHFSIKSITGYRDQTSHNFTPAEGGVAPDLRLIVNLGENAHQFSEELQLHYDTSRFHGTLGGYYFNETDDYTPGSVIFSGAVLNQAFGNFRTPGALYQLVSTGGLFKTRSRAVFGQGTYDIGHGLSLIAGLRYSSDRKSLDERYAFTVNLPYNGQPIIPPGIPQPRQTFTSTTPRLGLQYQIDPNHMLYFTYAKGFKAGGIQPGLPSTAFQPEKLTDYEGGLKSIWLSGKLRTAIDGFYYQYTNLQVQQLQGLSVATTNAASATVYGIEAEFSARPVDPLAINGSFTWLHARYDSFQGSDAAAPLIVGNVDFSGRALNNSPKFSAHLSAEYTWQTARGSVVLKGDSEYSSKYFFSPDNVPLLGQLAYVRGNAFLTYRADRNWYVTAFVRNIGNIAQKVSAVVNTVLVGTPVQGSYAPPRTFGAELGYKF